MPDKAFFSELNYRAVATIYHRLKASFLDDDITIALCWIDYTVLRSGPDGDIVGVIGNALKIFSGFHADSTA